MANEPDKESSKREADDLNKPRESANDNNKTDRPPEGEDVEDFFGRGRDDFQVWW